MNNNKSLKFILWGTGTGSRRTTEYIERNKEIFNIDIIAYTDNNSNKWNSKFLGKPVIPINVIKNMEYDCIEVASIKASEIKKQCIEELDIPQYKISCQGEILRKLYVQYQYSLKYGNKKIDSEQIVVYTANFGKYDILQEPVFRNDNIKYVCFTDNQDFKSDIWEVNYISSERENPIMLSRYYKFFPDKFFPTYDLSIWIDSKFLIKGDFRQYLNLYLKSKDILCFPHFARNCIYDEAEECIRIGKCNSKDLHFQIETYKLESYPKNNGLYEAGCIARKHNSEKSKKIMKLWWDEFKTYSTRDQISFSYVLWKEGYKPDICNLDIINNPFFCYIGHI